MTGESNDAAELRGFDRHTLALGAVTAVPAVVALLPYLAAELPVLAPLLWEEVSLLAYAARGVFATVTSWIATHPDEALAWAEVAVGLGIDAGEDPEGFYDSLQTTEGWFRVATTLFFSVLPVRGSRARGGDDEASGTLGSSRDGHAADGPAPAVRGPARAGSLGTPEQVQHATVVTVDRLQAFATAVRTRADHVIGTQDRRSPTLDGIEDAHTPYAGTDHDGRGPRGPRPRILEPFAGDKLDSARDLARQHPGAQVVAAEARFPPSAADIARFRAEGGEFLAERFAESLPPGSVEKIYVRYPIPHAKGVENNKYVDGAAISAEMARVPGTSYPEAARRVTSNGTSDAEIESMTNLGPHAIEKLTMGGTMEIVYWEKEVASEVRALTGRDYLDPLSGQRFSVEIASPPVSVRRDSFPNSGLGIPPHVEVVSMMTIQKVEVP